MKLKEWNWREWYHTFEQYQHNAATVVKLENSIQQTQQQLKNLLAQQTNMYETKHNDAAAWEQLNDQIAKCVKELNDLRKYQTYVQNSLAEAARNLEEAIDLMEGLSHLGTKNGGKISVDKKTNPLEATFEISIPGTERKDVFTLSMSSTPADIDRGYTLLHELKARCMELMEKERELSFHDEIIVQHTRPDNALKDVERAEQKLEIFAAIKEHVRNMVHQIAATVVHIDWHQYIREFKHKMLECVPAKLLINEWGHALNDEYRNLQNTFSSLHDLSEILEINVESIKQLDGKINDINRQISEIDLKKAKRQASLLGQLIKSDRLNQKRDELLVQRTHLMQERDRTLNHMNVSLKHCMQKLIRDTAGIQNKTIGPFTIDVQNTKQHLTISVTKGNQTDVLKLNKTGRMGIQKVIDIKNMSELIKNIDPSLTLVHEKDAPIPVQTSTPYGHQIIPILQELEQPASLDTGWIKEKSEELVAKLHQFGKESTGNNFQLETSGNKVSIIVYDAEGKKKEVYQINVHEKVADVVANIAQEATAANNIVYLPDRTEEIYVNLQPIVNILQSPAHSGLHASIQDTLVNYMKGLNGSRVGDHVLQVIENKTGQVTVIMRDLHSLAKTASYELKSNVQNVVDMMNVLKNNLDKMQSMQQVYMQLERDPQHYTHQQIKR